MILDTGNVQVQFRIQRINSSSGIQIRQKSFGPLRIRIHNTHSEFFRRPTGVCTHTRPILS
jgi:hypothetical protein